MQTEQLKIIYVIMVRKYIATFYWSAFTKPGQWAVMYLCVRGIYQARTVSRHVFVC